MNSKAEAVCVRRHCLCGRRVLPFRGSRIASFAALVESSSASQCGWWWIWFIEWEQIKIHARGLSHTSCQEFVNVGEVIILIQKSVFHRSHFKHNFHVIVVSLYLEGLDLLFDFYTCAISHTMMLITCFSQLQGYLLICLFTLSTAFFECIHEDAILGVIDAPKGK